MALKSRRKVYVFLTEKRHDLPATARRLAAGRPDLEIVVINVSDERQRDAGIKQLRRDARARARVVAFVEYSREGWPYMTYLCGLAKIPFKVLEKIYVSRSPRYYLDMYIPVSDGMT